MDSSVTTWIGLLKTGQVEAAQNLWDRFFPRLVELARDRLQGLPKRMADEEDVALSAFDVFCRAAANGRIPQLNDREDLWRTLMLITTGKAIDLRRHQQAQKRGGKSDDLELLEEVVGREPDPALATMVAEECQNLFDRLDDNELQQIAISKLEGYTNEEIAGQQCCSLRTVIRRLGLIRRTLESMAEAARA